MSVEKYGQSGAGAEDDDAALLEVALGAPRDVGLGDLRHRDRRLHARGGAGLLEEVLQGERVHDRAEHAHVVGTAAVHAALAELGTAEEVAAADDDGDLDAIDRFGDLAGDLADHVGVDAQLSAAERLSGQLQQDAAAFRSPHRSRVILSSSTNYPSPWPIAQQKGSASRRCGPFQRCYAPTLKRAKPVTVRPASFATWATDSLLSFA